MKKLFLLPVILLFTAATYGPPFSVSDFSSLTNRPNPSAVNPVGVVLGKTNAYDGNGGIFVFTPSSTNAVDGDIYLSTTTTGRWVRLTRDLATIQSPLVLSNGTLSLAALTNYFTFLAGTNMQVTVTSNTVTYAMTNTVGSGNRITVNGGLVTNFWDNGFITFLDAGGGDYSLNIGNDTISTNKINSTFYNWILSLSGGGGGTTNGLGVNGTFRTDWNAISSAEIAYTVSAGTNWYGSLVAGSVAANKLATTGTGTSTNFLAGDFAYKQVTTNMIPGLNAILSTIGTGGSGESNTASNLGTPSATNQGWYASKSGVDLQFRSLQVGPNLTLTSNANSIRLDVTLSTNSGTVVSVDGGSSLATVNFADTTGIGVTLTTTNASFALVDRDFGDLTVSSSGTVMTLDNNVITSNKVAAANITQDKLGTSGTGFSTNFLAGDYSYKQVTTNMIPGLNAILSSFQSILSFTNGVTNSAGVVSANIAAGSNITLSTNNGRITIASTASGSGTGSVVTANGGSDMSRANITTNGFGLLVTQSGTNILLSTTNNYPVDYYAGGFLPLFAGISNSLTGNLHYKKNSDIRSPMWESGTEWNAMGMRANAGVWSVVEYNTNDFTVLESFITIDPTDTTGPTDIITFPNSGFNNKVVFEADVELNGNVIAGTQTLGTSNTTVATTAFVQQNKGGSGSDTNWNGNPIASGTITNLTTENVNGNWFYDAGNGDIFVDGEFGNVSVVNQFYPFTGSANGTGSASVSTGTEDHPFTGIITSGSSANGGYRYPWVTGFERVANGKMWEVGFMMLNTNHTFGKFGYMSTFAAADSSDSSQISITNGVAIGSNASNSVYSVTGTSYTLSNSNWYRARGVIENGSAIFSILDTNGVVLWSDTNTTRVPLLRSSVTLAVSFWNTNTVATNLIQLDFIGRKTKQRLLR